MRSCGNCDMTDGMCYTSCPPQVRCTVTGEFHGYGDRCNVEFMPARIGKPKEHIRKICSSRGDVVMAFREGYECPFCGDPDIKNFCPSCGAKMDGDSNG